MQKQEYITMWAHACNWKTGKRPVKQYQSNVFEIQEGLVLIRIFPNKMVVYLFPGVKNFTTFEITEQEFEGMKTLYLNGFSLDDVLITEEKSPETLEELKASILKDKNNPYSLM